MSARQRLACCVGLFVALAGIGSAETLVPAWVERYRTALPDGIQRPLAARFLADGTLMVAGQDNQCLVAVRYGSAGQRVSVASMAGAGGAVAIDAFGRIFTNVRGNAVQKYDGITGGALWKAPAFDGLSVEVGGIETIAVDSNGDAIVSGRTTEVSPRIVTSKIDGATGGPRWPSPVLSTSIQPWIGYPLLMALDGTGDVFLVASRSNGPSTQGILILKYAGASGSPSWPAVVYQGASTYPETSLRLVVDEEGNAIVAVFTSSTDTSYAIALLKVNGGSGALAWVDATTIPGVVDVSLATDSRGDVIVGGSSVRDDLSTLSTTMKFDGATGAPSWPGPSFAESGPYEVDWGTTAVADVAGDVFVAGTAMRRLNGATGATRWESPPPGRGFSTLSTLLDASGNPYAVGASYDEKQSQDIVVQAYSASSGAPLWPNAARETGRCSFFDDPVAMAIDPSGNIAVTATTTIPIFESGTTGPPSEFATMRFGGADGKPLWPKAAFFDESRLGLDAPTSVGVDQAGNVFVTGFANWGMTTLKYDASIGSVVWSRSFRAYPANDSRGLAVDSRGDVFVTGRADLDSGRAIVTLKYRGSDGAEGWPSPAFETDPRGGYPFPRALNVDAAGNAFMLGSLGLFKYEGTSGRTIWASSASATGPLGERATATTFGIDPSGDLALAGWAFDDSNTAKYAAFKMSGATGSLQWPVAATFGILQRYSLRRPTIGLGAAANVFVSGASGTDVNRDVLTVKLDATSGVSLWPAPATLDGADRVAKSLGVDPSGNLFLGAASGTDLATVAYDGASGGELLRPVLPAGATGSAVDLKMLGDDPVLLSGSEGGLLLVRYTRRLGIETLAESVPPAYCGRAYQFHLVGRNGLPPYQWNVVSGSLPPGLILDRDRVTGEAVITGTPTGIGTFSFRIRLRDSASPHKAEAFRDYAIAVYDGQGFVTLAASANPVCLGSTTTLTVPGIWSSYRWLPGGEPTSTLAVSPSNPTTYGVVVTETSGCTRRGAITVGVVPNRPAVTAPPSVTVLQTSCSP